jgi:Zn-dependent membrane protease YugP
VKSSHCMQDSSETSAVRSHLRVHTSFELSLMFLMFLLGIICHCHNDFLVLLELCISSFLPCVSLWIFLLFLPSICVGVAFQ